MDPESAAASWSEFWAKCARRPRRSRPAGHVERILGHLYTAGAPLTGADIARLEGCVSSNDLGHFLWVYRGLKELLRLGLAREVAVATRSRGRPRYCEITPAGVVRVEGARDGEG